MLASQNGLINHIFCQTRGEHTVRTRCPGFQPYCTLVLGIDTCEKSFLSTITKICHQEKWKILSRHRHIIDRIWYETQCEESRTKSLSNSIMTANRFFIVWYAHYHLLLFSTKQHFSLWLMSITSMLTQISCTDAHWCFRHLFFSPTGMRREVHTSAKIIRISCPTKQIGPYSFCAIMPYSAKPSAKCFILSYYLFHLFFASVLLSAPLFVMQSISLDWFINSVIFDHFLFQPSFWLESRATQLTQRSRKTTRYFACGCDLSADEMAFQNWLAGQWKWRLMHVILLSVKWEWMARVLLCFQNTQQQQCRAEWKSSGYSGAVARKTNSGCNFFCM
jgi:hypothetical protein